MRNTVSRRHLKHEMLRPFPSQCRSTDLALLRHANASAATRYPIVLCKELPSRPICSHFGSRAFAALLPESCIRCSQRAPAYLTHLCSRNATNAQIAAMRAELPDAALQRPRLSKAQFFCPKANASQMRLMLMSCSSYFDSEIPTPKPNACNYRSCSLRPVRLLPDERIDRCLLLWWSLLQLLPALQGHDSQSSSCKSAASKYQNS
jgi:hypothetical protein